MSMHYVLRSFLIQFVSLLQCKLDTPIFVDDSIVSFRLNEDTAIPAAEEEAVAIGFGRNFSGRSDETGNPQVLQEVTLNVDDSHCFQPPGNLCTCTFPTRMRPYGTLQFPNAHCIIYVCRCVTLF